MATWMKDPETGEKILVTPATAPKARCCVEVAEVKKKTTKAFIPTTVEPEPLLTEPTDEVANPIID